MFKILRPLVLLLTFTGLSFAQENVPTESLRIATYNAYLLSPAFRCLDPTQAAADCLLQIPGQTEAWATNLADLVLRDAENIDVLALNEVWDEDARKILAEKLRDVFPRQIRKIDASLPIIPIGGEDSGLMLFAKADFEFLDLPNDAFQWGGLIEGLDADTEQVAFTGYGTPVTGACAGIDCFAAKGAALVRLRNTNKGLPVNVVFTHMQAEDIAGGEDNGETRDGQFEKIEELIVKTIDPEGDGRERRDTTFMLGDLNVPYVFKRAEYNRRFEKPGSFFSDTLHDVWNQYGNRDDSSESNDVEFERLDYILSGPDVGYAPNGRNRTTCVQHVTMPVPFRELESDHYMVRADVNAPYWYCSPTWARNIHFSEGDVQEIGGGGEATPEAVTRINTPGAMQWFEISAEEAKHAGTYSIGVNNPDMQIDLFLATEMTTPVQGTNVDPVDPPVDGLRNEYKVFQYAMPPAERFFIRVRGIKRETVGDYKLLIVAHDCATQRRACILRADGSSSFAELSGTDNAGASGFQSEAWFKFKVWGLATSGKQQTVTLAAKYDPARAYPKLVEEPPFDLAGLQKAGTEGDPTFTGALPPYTIGYLLIRQGNDGTDNTTVSASLTTNLRVISWNSLVCRDETNPELGSDDIYTNIEYDSVVKRVPFTGNVSFDCDASQDAKPWMSDFARNRLLFLDYVSVTIFEEDDTSPDDPTRTQFRSAVDLGDGAFEWSDFEGGHYRLPYVIRYPEPFD